MMRRLGLILALGLSAPLMAALAPGAAAPEIKTTIAMAGKSAGWSLSAALKKGPVVLYFYPAAFTPGCSLEANKFAEAIPDFRKYKAQVVGLSADALDTLKKFSVTECRKKFPVGIATPEAIAAFDVALTNGPRSNRTSYVIAPDGRIIHSYSNGDYREHVPRALAALAAHKAAKGK